MVKNLTRITTEAKSWANFVKKKNKKNTDTFTRICRNPDITTIILQMLIKATEEFYIIKNSKHM